MFSLYSSLGSLPLPKPGKACAGRPVNTAARPESKAMLAPALRLLTGASCSRGTSLSVRGRECDHIGLCLLSQGPSVLVAQEMHNPRQLTSLG